MHTYFRFKGLLLLVLALFVYGCSGSAADPMGTGTIQFVTEYSEPYGTGTPGKAIVITTVQVDPNSSLSLTVWVSNFNSKGEVVPVIGERVTFSLDSTENGARLAVLNDRTGSNGEARVVYLAGNNLFPDVVRATTSVGATASITITKTGSTTRGSVVALTASANTVSYGGFSTITATVTDNGKPVQGERVNFTLLTNKGASLSVQSGLTNGSGQVITAYRAGSNGQDVIQASLSNGATAQVMITVSGGPTGLPVVTLTASPSSVLPLGYSTITAKVTDNGLNIPGEAITFTLMTNNGASLSVQSGTTDANGQAITTYQAGNNNSQDVIQASLGNGATAQVIITKTGVGPGTSIELASNPAIVAPGGFSIITATVTDSGGNLVSGVRVYFTLTTPNGSIDRSELITDGNGVARIVYTAGNGTGTDILQATTDGGFAQLIITKSSSPPPTTTITLTADPSSITAAIAANPSSAITATVRNSAGVVQSGVTIHFSVFPSGTSTFSVNDVVTGADGKALTVLTISPANEGTYVVQATSVDPVMSAAISIAVTNP